MSKIKLFVLFVVLSCLFISCDSSIDEVGGVYFESHELVTVEPERYHTIWATGASQNTVWLSSDPTVVTVDGWYDYEENKYEVFLTTLKPGEVTITVHTESNQDSINVKVLDIDAENITLYYPTYLVVGKTYNFRCSFFPDNVTQTEIEWQSSDEEVASVDENGNVSALKEGNVTITVICGEATDSAEIAVVPAIENIEIKSPINRLLAGSAFDLTAKLVPENADIGSIIQWNSSNESVAIVDSTGHVVGLSTGMSAITATVDDIESFPLYLTVLNPENIFWQTNSIELSIGEEYLLNENVEVTPNAYFNDSKLTFQTESDTIEIVDNVLVAKKEGQAKVKVGLGSLISSELTVNVTDPMIDGSTESLDPPIWIDDEKTYALDGTRTITTTESDTSWSIEVDEYLSLKNSLTRYIDLGSFLYPICYSDSYHIEEQKSNHTKWNLSFIFNENNGKLEATLSEDENVEIKLSGVVDGRYYLAETTNTDELLTAEIASFVMNAKEIAETVSFATNELEGVSRVGNQITLNNYIADETGTCVSGLIMLNTSNDITSFNFLLDGTEISFESNGPDKYPTFLLNQDKKLYFYPDALNALRGDMIK